MRFILLITLIHFLCPTIEGQNRKQWNSAEIHQGIKKLNFLGSALYVAAHPDDENTRLISYLSNHVMANTAYLSMTRGDGGQNLIGTELKELLGVIRTQELLAARRLDGGSQYFTRANDFGYSKHPDETLKIWEQDEVLADVVWTIRNFKPDIIINRFKHDTPGSTHGHHTSSAVLSHEAYDLSGDASKYPEQLKYTDPWQAKRLYFNTSWWFYGSREKFAEADKTRLLNIDAGVYYPHLGMSNGEIAMISRAQHKCQGMGRALNRGSQTEWLEVLKGDVPMNKENLFDGIDTSWGRVKGGAQIGDMLLEIDKNFDPIKPYESVKALVKVYHEIEALADGYWKQIKIEEIKELILQCSGLFAQVNTESYSATAGEEMELAFEFTNRSNSDITLKGFEIPLVKKDSTFNLTLNNGEDNKFYKKITLPQSLDASNPYWLEDKGSLGMYRVDDRKIIGNPESKPVINVNYTLEIEGQQIPFSMNAIYKSVDPVEGESYRPFVVVPEVSVSILDKVFILTDDQAQKVRVKAMAGKAGVQGSLRLKTPSGWIAKPSSIPFEFSKKEEEQIFEFELSTNMKSSEAEIGVEAQIGNKTYEKELVLIQYDHIPTQTINLPTTAKVVKLDIEKRGETIGYLMGAGDKIPESLKQIGYDVVLLEDEDVSPENLQKFDAVIVGIRAYNTRTKMKFHQEKLLDYVKNGGTMIVQYNTSHRLKVPSEELGPYPFKLSRDRVSVEEAPVKMLAKDHTVLNYPNKITEKDFDNWISERGLYFPNEWDDRYTAILSSHDPNEPAREGGLLVAKYGEGYYIYSGYSWFRELPAGVTGAYRLFANMLSIGK